MRDVRAAQSALAVALEGVATPGPAPQGRAAATDDRVLDAAIRVVAEFGTRMNMDDLAQRAGVSRATLFRRFGNKEAVIQRLFVRETARVVMELGAVVGAAGDPRTGLVDLVDRAVAIALENPLLQRVIRYETQTLIDVSGRGDPTPVALGRAFLTAQVQAARPERRPGQPTAEVLGDLLARLLLAYVLVPDPPRELLEPVIRREMLSTVVETLLGP